MLEGGHRHRRGAGGHAMSDCDGRITIGLFRLFYVAVLVSSLFLAASAELAWSSEGGTNHTLEDVVGSPETLQQRRWRGVSRQKRSNTCATAATHTLLVHDYAQEGVPPLDELRRRMLSELSQEQREAFARSGFSFSDIKRTLQSFGFVVRGLRMPLSTLVEVRAPAIVQLRSGELGHFAVWRGAANGRVYLADPARGNVVTPIERFGEKWTGYVLLPARQGERPKEYARADIAAVIASWRGDAGAGAGAVSE